MTRVAREVGTEGKLGGQAQVSGVSGTWKDLTENVNLMASNLTDQVRGIARVVTAIANGDLKKKLTVEAKGEIAALTDTINNLIDTLATFTDQVTGVAREVGVEGKLGGQARVPGASGTWRDLTDNVNQLAANLTTQVRAIAEVATAVAKGDLTREIGVAAQGEVAVLKDNINEMIRNLKDTTDKNTEQDWLKTHLARFTRMLQGQREIMAVYKLILSELAPLVNASHGVFYGMQQAENEEPRLVLQAGYAYKERKNLSKHFRLGEGLIGECAMERERILLTNVPGDYVQINSGLGHATPLNIVVLPVLFEGETKAVIELASFQRFSPTHLTFLEQLTESIGIVLNSIEVNSRTAALLQQSQKMAMALQNQQEELQQTNEELEQKARLLADQNTAVERKNQEVEIAKRALEEKAAQLSLTSKYKSEFLANMSHELRTPLNSLLLLSQQLRDNPDQNLTEKQVEYAATIFASGNDLLNLINDILDLSKIESGTVTADIGDVQLGALRSFVEQTFRHIAEDRKLEFSVDFDAALPETMLTDERRVKQILKNLLSNAFKFTEQGRVALRVARAIEGWGAGNASLNTAERVIVFSVNDSGIGIAPDKQRVIFEAFQQADGTTSRKYGGTGLGLAISRELANLLGGEITVNSVEGQGSVFSLYLPDRYVMSAIPSELFPGAQIQPVVTPERRRRSRVERALRQTGAAGGHPDLMPAQVAEPTHDDRAFIQPGDRVLLIAESEPPVAAMLRDFAHERGFKTLVAAQGHTALALAGEYRPDAITLDVQLPDMSGWSLLDCLKHDPVTRHIPVHVLSAEGENERSRRLGALAWVKKPVGKEELAQSFARIEDFLAHKVKNVLVVEDQTAERARIVELLSSRDVDIATAGTGSEALAALKQSQFDCLVLDLGLPDTTGFEVIEEIKKDPGLRTLPIIVYTARDLTREEENRLKKVIKSVILKDVRSLDRLLDEVTLFLHQVESDLPEFKRKILEQVRKTDPMLADKKVLVVDDDVRNIFSLTAVLERHRMQVLSAENGKDAIDLLKKHPDTDIVLMDVMMPEMDGYETTRAIRKQSRFKALPIISLTAKAMKGDREKCIEAGASDYITKPVNTEQLLSLLRVWLYR
ncbi:MAG: response regulator [Thiobacillus sp.]